MQTHGLVYLLHIALFDRDTFRSEKGNKNCRGEGDFFFKPRSVFITLRCAILLLLKTEGCTLRTQPEAAARHNHAGTLQWQPPTVNTSSLCQGGKTEERKQTPTRDKSLGYTCIFLDFLLCWGLPHTREPGELGFNFLKPCKDSFGTKNAICLLS